MSEPPKQTDPTTSGSEAEAEAVEQTPAEDPAAERSVKRGGLIVFLVIVLSLVWYIGSDRFTPYTSQARVQGYVIGVAPSVSGRVVKVHVGNNQRVEKDQVLFEIDPESYEIALQKAKSDLEQAKLQVGAGSAGVDSAEAKLRAALANQEKAQKDLTRMENLYAEDPGTISVRRLEIARANLSQAEANVDAAKAEIQRAKEQMGHSADSDNAILQTARSAVEKAALDLSKTQVKASTAGFITDLRTEVGQYASTANPVMTFIAIDDVWINAEFTENNLGHMRKGTPVEILIDSLPGRVLLGHVRSIGLGISTGQPPPPGSLPTIQNNRDWLRQAQRFPVVIGFDQLSSDETVIRQLRIGGQASVMAYSEDAMLLRWLGELLIRALSWLSYAY